MEHQVIFRDFQEAQTEDFNNIQAFTQGTFDDLIHDVVTGSLRYAGFNIVKSNQAEITVAPGRFYGANDNNLIGALYTLPTQTIINLAQYLPVAGQRILTIAVGGVTNQLDVQTRDYLIDTQTLQTQPQAVAMQSSRDAVLSIFQGAQSTSPTAPAIGVSTVGIANVLLDTNGVVSVTMLPDGLITSTEQLNTRLLDVESFDALTGPRISALATDLADLANRINSLAQQGNIVEVYKDLAAVKEKVGLPSTFSQYGATYYLYPDPTEYDVNNAQALGYSALINYGIRFPAQNANVFTLALFNPLDANAAYSNGLLLPSYTSVLKLQNGPASAIGTSIAIGQYGYVTYALKEQDIAYTRTQIGPSYTVCTNGVQIYSPGEVHDDAWWLPNWQSYTTSNVETDMNVDGIPGHNITTTRYYWVDSWTEPYWSLDTVNHSINGAQIAQSFLVSSDMWVTIISVYLASVANPSADIWFSLCKCTNGVPDLTQVIAHQNITAANLHAGVNNCVIPPTFCAKGDRMAVVITSAANHQIGVVPGGTYLDGTFFTTLDGSYFLGDFTKEIWLQISGAQFDQAQVTIELTALNLAGGIRNIDITARQVVPASCNLVFEVLPDGTGTWLPLTQDNPLVPFAGAPVLARFRARFVGTQDVMPGIVLSDSIVKIWTPGPTYNFVSQPETLLAASTNITVQATVENYDPVAHTIAVKLWYGGPPIVVHNPTATTIKLVDASAGRYTVTATFTGIPSTAVFTYVIAGTTNSVADTYHVADTTWWAL